MHEIHCSIDHALDFFRTEDGRQFPRYFRERQIIKMDVAPLEHLLEEEPQGRHSDLHRGRSELSFLQQVPLEALNVRGSQAVWWLTEIIRELLDRQNIATDCGF